VIEGFPLANVIGPYQNSFGGHTANAAAQFVDHKSFTDSRAEVYRAPQAVSA
jgi:hypothetical protein